MGRAGRRRSLIDRACARAVHAVIGTNGAGKSTPSPALRRDRTATNRGAAGNDVSGWTQAKRARAAGRSYQRTTIFSPFSVLRNLRLPRRQRPEPWTWWQDAQRAADRAKLEYSGAARGTGRESRAPRGLLSHGEKRSWKLRCALRPIRRCCCWTALAGMGPRDRAHACAAERASGWSRHLLSSMTWTQCSA